MAKFETHFIEQNKLPSEYIEVYNGDEKVGRIKANALKLPEMGSKLYSFGALSDVHVTVTPAAMSNFHNAINYFNNVERVAFTVVAGDMTGQGTSEQFATWRNAVAEHSVGAPIYTVTGNHDVQEPTIAPFLTQTSTQPYLGQDLYYSFTQGNDVFIFFGMSGWYGKTGTIFTEEQIQWLHNILDANRNKRCFVIEHCPNMAVANGLVSADSGSGSIIGLSPPTGNLLNGDGTAAVFRAMLKHYHNVVWLHGHSHMGFEEQARCSQLNYDNKWGCHSVHIPSSAAYRVQGTDGGWGDKSGKGYGYVVDVYENHIVLRGRDFVSNKFIPIASFCLDTTLQNVEGKPYSYFA